MKSFFKLYWPLAIFGALALGILLGLQLNMNSNPLGQSKTTPKNKLNKLLDFIEREYVDSVNTDSIVDVAVSEILEKLDPHSVYISKSEIAQVNESMKGNFVGIGVQFYRLKDTVTVTKIIPGGPSEAKGIMAGDRILSANGKNLFGNKITTQDIYNELRGKEGTSVTLKLFRKKENKTFQVKINRGIVPLKSVEVALEITPKIGYIKVSRFSESTYEEFQKALVQLTKTPKESIVIDLRDNTGGYMDKAIKMADEFLPEGDLIVSTKTKNGREEKSIATSIGLFEKGKVVVLINENSASASEIFAGAIQDNDRGVIIGRRSFGKGLVQRDMEMGDGSVVRLTIAKYYTPSGRSIQKPYNSINTEAYFNDFQERFQKGELYEKDAIAIADSLKFKTKKGKIVYGGGGIMPDVFVGLDKNFNSHSFWMLEHQSFFDHLAFYIYEKHTNPLDGVAYQNLSSFLKSNNYFLVEVKSYLNEQGIDPKVILELDLWKKSLEKAMVKQLYGDMVFYQHESKIDPMIQASIQWTNNKSNK
jgi:carboxyl-terminal processing protease